MKKKGDWQLIASAILVCFLAGFLGRLLSENLPQLDIAISFEQFTTAVMGAQCCGIFVVFVVAFAIFLILPKPQSKE